MSDRSKQAWASVADAFGDFSQSVDAIMELARFTRSRVVELDTLHGPCGTVTEEIVRLSPTTIDADELRAAVTTFWEAAQSELGRGASAMEAMDSDAAPRLKPAITNFVESAAKLGLGRWVVLLVVQRFFEHRTRPERSPILQESLLVSAVAVFEAYIARMVRAGLEHSPKQLYGMASGPVWKDVFEADGLDQLKVRAIDQFVDGLMHGDLQSWLNHIGSATRMRADDRDKILEMLREFVQRRHVLVHAGGVVSAQYLEKVGRKGQGLHLGDRLVVTAEYLDTALDALALAGICVAQAAFAAIFRTEKSWSSPTIDATQSPTEAVFRHLYNGRNALAAQAYPLIESYVLDDSSRQNLKVNSWIGRKRIYGVEEIREEVRAWDTSSLDARYAVARHCLLDEVEEALPILAKLLTAEDLSEVAVATWPIFEPVREHLRATIGKALEDVAGSTVPDGASEGVVEPGWQPEAGDVQAVEDPLQDDPGPQDA